MFDALFGWRKASKCKKLIKRFQCRLKLVKNKRHAIAKQLREDIVQLLKDGHQHIAFKRVDELHVDENMILVFEFLDQFSEFIVLNLSYLRKHKDLPDDLNEAIATLVFASARCRDLPELILIRKLFRKRYGHKFTTTAVELHPENLVNQQVKEKLTSHSSVSEEVKNKLLNEIVKDFFHKPEILPLECKQDFLVQHKKDTELHEPQEVLALEYKPEFQAQIQKVTESFEDYEMQGKCISVNSSASTSSCSTVLQSSPSIAESPKREPMLNLALLSSPYECESGAIEVRKVEENENSGGGSSSENSSYCNSGDSVIYLDDVQEYKSPIKKGSSLHCGDQDQRCFVFSFSSLEDINLATKRLKRRSVCREKPAIDDVQCEVYYSRSTNRRKSQKRVHFEGQQIYCLVDHGSQEVEPSDNSNEGREIVLVKDYAGSPLAQNCEALAPYTKNVTECEMEIQITEVSRANSASPRHVHPKLPDCDELEAKFRALKKLHQQNKCTWS